jgi:CRISPR-associated protein Csb2
VRHPLIAEVGRLRDAMRNPHRPPGMTMQRYKFASAPFAASPTRRPRDSEPVDVVVIRLVLTPKAGGVLPHRFDSVRVGAAVRAAVMRRFQDATDEPPTHLSGKGDDGRPLRGHIHAHFIPWCGRTGDDSITDVFVYARYGIPEDEARAVGSLRRLTIGHDEDRREFDVVCAGMTALDAEGGLDEDQLSAKWPAFGESTVWVSATPYVAVRHPKLDRRGNYKLDADGRRIDDLEDQLRRDLNLRGYRPVSVEPVSHCLAARAGQPWHRFETRRSSSSPRPPLPPGGFRLTFDEPVRGPLLLGGNSHFGLGLFVPE